MNFSPHCLSLHVSFRVSLLSLLFISFISTGNLLVTRTSFPFLSLFSQSKSILCSRHLVAAYLAVRKTKKGQCLQSNHVSCVYPLISCHLAKQKLEDRLAAAAREKLAQASKESKEKQLQAERKRKAALFLQTLRSPFAGEPEAKRAELDACAQLEVGKWLQRLHSVSHCVFLFLTNDSKCNMNHYSCYTCLH